MLSVVIPTRDRPARLRACLATLAESPAPYGGFEVLVVDDGSRTPLVEALSGEPQLSIDLRFVRQAPRGLNEARNTGVAHSYGDLIAFLDDDTLVDSGWPQAIVDAFRFSHCVAAGGRVVLRLEADPPKWMTPKLRRYLAEYDLGDVPVWVNAGPFPVGANCAVRRSTFDDVGGFSAGLDRTGRSLLSNGDSEFFRRVARGGGGIRYEPGALVEHCVPEDRLTREFFLRRAHAQGRSDELTAAAEHRRGSLAREMVRSGRSIPIAARSLMEGRGVANARFWIEYCRGRVAGLGDAHGRTRH